MEKPGIGSWVSQHPYDVIFMMLVVSMLAAINLSQWEFQHCLAQNDHGRELYLAWKVYQGETPYVDFNWYYGPLMLYYYASCFQLFGLNIGSAKLGWTILFSLAVLIMYGGTRRFLSPLFAWGATTAFMAVYPLWFHSYNHIGVTLALVLFLFLLPPLATKLHVGHQVMLVGIIVLASLIKFNVAASFGFAVALSSLLWMCIAERRQAWKSFVAWTSASVALVAAGYAVFLWQAPWQYFSRWFPYSQNRLVLQIGVWDSLGQLFHLSADELSQMFYYPPCWIFVLLPLVFCAVVITGIVCLLWRLARQKFDSTSIMLTYLCVILVCNSHEFWLRGTEYSLLYFGLPFLCALYFMMLQDWLGNHKTICGRVVLYGSLAVCSLCAVLLCRWQWQAPRYSLALTRGQIQVIDPLWAQVITQASQYVQANSQPTEKILALPADQIYYFLSERTGATREDFFVPASQISPDEEDAIIADLQNHHVSLILLSNQFRMPAELGGGFGTLNCQKLISYIDSHYSCVATFGPWETIPDWYANHAVKILRRRTN